MEIFNIYNAKINFWKMCTKDISILIFLLISMTSNKNHKRVFMLKDTVIFSYLNKNQTRDQWWRKMSHIGKLCVMDIGYGFGRSCGYWRPALPEGLNS